MIHLVVDTSDSVQTHVLPCCVMVLYLGTVWEQSEKLEEKLILSSKNCLGFLHIYDRTAFGEPCMRSISFCHEFFI